MDRPGQGVGGVPKIPKLVRTSFMDDHLVYVLSYLPFCITPLCVRLTLICYQFLFQMTSHMYLKGTKFRGYLIWRLEKSYILQVFNFAIWKFQNILRVFNFAISVKESH